MLLEIFIFVYMQAKWKILTMYNYIISRYTFVTASLYYQLAYATGDDEVSGQRGFLSFSVKRNAQPQLGV